MDLVDAEADTLTQSIKSMFVLHSVGFWPPTPASFRIQHFVVVAVVSSVKSQADSAAHVQNSSTSCRIAQNKPTLQHYETELTMLL